LNMNHAVVIEMKRDFSIFFFVLRFQMPWLG
jgi:hypothetical protein